MAGAKAGGSAGFQKTTNNGQQSVDTNTRNQLGAIQNAYGAAGAAGPGPLLTGAAGYGTTAQGAGNLGFGALTGNQNAINTLMNPYINTVIGANDANAAKAAQQGTNQLNAQATAAGAFGGSRQGVAEGTMLANNQMNLNTLNANLLNSGYGTAMGQASGLANLGFSGAGLNSQLGMQGVGNQSLWNAQQLRNGFIMPTGSNYGGAQSTASGNANFSGWVL